MSRTAELLQRFTIGYAHATLWANTYGYRAGSEETHDVEPEWWQSPSPAWQLEAFTGDSREAIETECRDFVTANLRDVMAYARTYPDRWSQYGSPTDPRALEARMWETAGHDFALTRNHHGAGFWDRGLGEIGERLTVAAHAYGEQTGSVDIGDPAALVTVD